MKIMQAALLATAVGVIASPVQAIDIHNCTPIDIRILFYNESDRIELIAKKGIDIASGGAVTGMFVPGSGTHKARVLNASAGGRNLMTLVGIDGAASYVLVVDGNGVVAMMLGRGC